MAKVSKKLTFFLFADDTNIYYESSNILDIQKTFNKELRKARKWLEADRLALNIDKTNLLFFTLTKHTRLLLNLTRLLSNLAEKRSTRKLVRNFLECYLTQH